MHLIDHDVDIDGEVWKAHVPGYAAWLKEFTTDCSVELSRSVELLEAGTHKRAEASRSQCHLAATSSGMGILNVCRRYTYSMIWV